jgi:hypothetical protein
MNTLGPQVSAGLFTDRDSADRAWGALSNAGIPSAVIVDPGLLGKYEVSVMVERDDLDKAQVVLADFFND